MHYWRHLGTVFRILTLPSGKAWLQKTSEKCVLCLQFSFLGLALAALADKSFISSSTVIIFSRFFHTAFRFCCISIRHRANFLKICFPPSLGTIILPTAPKEFRLKTFCFWTCPTPFVATKCSLPLSKKHIKTNENSTISLFGPPWFEYALKLHIYKKVLPARAGSTFLQIGTQSCSTKIKIFGLGVPPNAFLPHMGRKADKQNTSEKCVLFAHEPALRLP